MTQTSGIHKRQLAEFLRGCRGRISPAEKGLPDHHRRRTPGLRREDVAVLAGVSLTWYTWLEQGRDITVSADILERICTALEMSSDERDYLFALVQHRAPPLPAVADQCVSPALQRMLDSLNVPALVKTARWDVIAWNALVTKLFRDYSQLQPGARNLLRILLVDDPDFQADNETHRATARRVLSKFRVDYSQHSDEPSFAALIEELTRDSAIFRELWNSPEVINRSEAIAHHPQQGGMLFEHTSYVPEGSPTLRVVVFAPQDEATAQKLAAVASGLAESAAKTRAKAQQPS